MYPAMSWDREGARVWSVMGRVRERQGLLRNQAMQARRRVRERETKPDLTPAAAAGAERDLLQAGWHGQPMVLAFLFSLPESATMRALDSGIDYLDQRTGDNWDLFFPGYYRQDPKQPAYEDRPIGYTRSSEWLFNALGFDIIRGCVERESGRRWHYSGDTDLVLVGGWLPEEGEPMIDWSLTMSGTLTDHDAGTSTLTLGAIVERISRDLERELEDPDFGVGAVVNPPQPHDSSTARELMVNTLAGIGAALAAKGLGV